MWDGERICRDVEARLSVVLLHGVCEEVVQKAEIEGEFLGHFEIVLNVVKLAGLLEGVVNEGRKDRSIQRPQQEVSRSEAGVGDIVGVAREISIEIELTAGIWRLQNGEVHTRLDLRADFDSVTPANQT